MLRDTASRYPLITLLPVNMHSLGIYLLSYRDLYLFSCRLVGMYSDGNCFSYYLPQLQQHAPGVLGVRSLALLAPSSRDQLTRYEEKFISSWQLQVALVPHQAGWHPPAPSQSHHPLWQEAPRKALWKVCPSPRASDGISAKHPAALGGSIDKLLSAN